MTKMKKHTPTPGPWIVEAAHVVPDFDAHPRANSDEIGRHSVAVCYGPDLYANARLIAAAPEMLAALTRLRDQDVNCSLEEDRAAWAQVNAAIAKAEGR